ncbi:MAG: hypothetical protein K0Q59_2399 [Paenibacillus sp.]|jgi:Mor family transcriptional regulator|nr:hypothetical protein [Paenibacillus sp.]
MRKYKNARDVLPESLIREIQKYVRGEHLYIPQTERSGWGEKSGLKDELERRNKEIFQQYMDGIPIAELAEMHHLSEERVRGILYEKHSEM